MPDECEHENTTEILFDARVNRGRRTEERKYEVAYCLDCNRLVNFYQDEPMNDEQIVQLFRDIKAGIDAIETAKDDLSNAIDETLTAYRSL